MNKCEALLLSEKKPSASRIEYNQKLLQT